MAKTPSSTLGIDIGANTIKIVEIKGGKPPSLTGVAIAPTPPNSVDSGGVLDHQAVGAAIKKMVAQAGFASKAAVVSIAGQNSVVVRILEVPKMAPAELKKHMDWEVQRNIPFADGRVHSDYSVVPRESFGAGDTIDVALAVAHLDAVDRLVSVTDASGLQPFAIDVEPLALGRSLLLSDPDLKDKNCIIVGIGAQSTSIDIFSKGLLTFPRILPTGGETLTRAIADRLMVPESEADETKLQYAQVIPGQTPTTTYSAPSYSGGFEPEATIQPTDFESPPMTSDPGFFMPTASDTEPSPFAAPSEPAPEASPFAVPGEPIDVPSPFSAAEPTPEPEPEDIPPPMPAFPSEPAAPAVVSADEAKRQSVYQAIYPVLEEIVSELRRSVEYYRSRAQDNQIDCVILCGGTSIVPNLDQLFSQAIGIPTFIGNPVKNLAVNVRKQGGEYVAAHSHELAVAIGLALHPYSS